MKSQKFYSESVKNESARENKREGAPNDPPLSLFRVE